MSKKITFTLPAEIVADANSGVLLGDFNNWDVNNGINLKKQKNGSLSATLTLETGKSYQYRYLLNDGRWVNDQNANYYIQDFQVENCVITVPEEIVPEEKIAKVSKPKATKAAKAVVASEAVAIAPNDDLTKIEGIGKKIAELLVASKITNFKELAKAAVSDIKAILDAAGSKFKMHNPGTWPKQAKLAAAGKWDELSALQAELKAGK